MAESLPELSVIVATRDRAERLAQCLAALDEAWAVVQVPWEVILVDNASTDHTAEVARDSLGNDARGERDAGLQYVGRLAFCT